MAFYEVLPVVAFYTTLAVGALLILLAVGFVLAWPTTYSDFQPATLSADVFTVDDKQEQNALKSGYSFYQRHKPSDSNDGNSITCTTGVAVVVLGDIGRSPRMQYHALSLARHGARVALVGYTGAELHPEVLANRFISIVAIPPFPPGLQASSRMLFLLTAPLKVLWQIFFLYHALAYRIPFGAPKWLLVQNPPSIPTLAVAALVTQLRNIRLVVDWHNFGYSILALRLGTSHPVVRLAEWYEGFFARTFASAHLAVTDAMRAVLRDKWDIAPSLTLHDRPADIYQPCRDASAREGFLSRCPETAPFAAELVSGACRLLVSSTSWTADEDFSVLLDALVTYAARRQQPQEKKLSALLALITGRGPQREYFLRQISTLTAAGRLPGVTIRTAWLTPEDYASLLAAADLGVSLHTSSSGVDLPMKVVDMFGAGLPVVGWGAFAAWGELVKEGVNGRGFASAEELAKLLLRLLGEASGGVWGDATAGGELERLRQNARKEGARRWVDEWDPVAGRLFGIVEN